MPSKIRVLDEHTINKIAAGEVIENPASVVKELVENAIDAGSTQICVEIQNGGRQLIRISDNGCGMSKDDALLCLERHATSKIREVEDIHAIYTMGFRGEALPSIASISKFLLITAEAEGEGTMLIVEGGKILKCCAASRAPGTTIEVKSLFFNIPVRKKFQKSPTYDTNEIYKIMTGISLGHPQISFELISDQKQLLKCHVDANLNEIEQLQSRIGTVLGKEFLDSTCLVNEETDHWRLKGVIGIPSYTRQNRTGQFLFINKRAVQSPIVSFAIKEGYGTMLMANRHPVYVLQLQLPSSSIDVNVHPQKREVRLFQEADLKSMIVRGIRKALQTDKLGESLAFSSFDPSFNPREFSSEPAPLPKSFIEFPISSEFKESFKYPVEAFYSYRPPISQKPFEARLAQTNVVELPQIPTKLVPRVLATFKDYLLIEGDVLTDKNGLGIIDQKAAYARVVFEKMQKAQQGITSNEIQPLLIPYSFEASSDECVLLLQNLESLNQMGIAIRQISQQAFLVDAIPLHFVNADLSHLIRSLIDDLQEQSGKEIVHQRHHQKMAWTISRFSSTYNRRLSVEEAQLLVNQLMECEITHLCPLGKNLITILTVDEIEKRLKR